jgi:hypothetical protein
MIEFLFALCIADRIFDRIFKPSGQTIYYVFHSLFNIYIAYISYEYLSMIFMDTQSYYYKQHFYEKSFVPVSYQLVYFHLYHSICYFYQLKIHDFYHHGMAFFCLSISCLYDISGHGYAISFFICGLPGFFYYFSLILLKMNLISKYREIQIQFLSNILIRNIGLIIVSYHTSVAYLNNYYHFNGMPFVIFTINTLLHFWNANYFMYLSSIEYHKIHHFE